MAENDAARVTGKGRKKRLIVWLILFVVCVIIAAGCLGVWVYHIVLRRAMNDLYDQARIEIAVLPQSPKEEDKNKDKLPKDTEFYESEGETESPHSDSEPLAIINFDLLKQSAPHVYAWIEIPGSEIAFPIVQHPTNNSYYLRRAISGAYDITGCIYTQNYNKLDFSDKNTLIYGHYMNDGTKFGSLLSYMDKEYFDSHRRIDVYTETHWYSYEVFAALPFDTRHILKTYDYAKDPYSEFLKDVFSSKNARTIIAEDALVDPEKDKIITLSTCLKTDTKRYIVLAKLVKSQLCE